MMSVPEADEFKEGIALLIIGSANMVQLRCKWVGRKFGRRVGRKTEEYA